MTLPHIDWDHIGDEDLVETVVLPDQLGETLQDQSESHYTGVSGSRFPGAVDGTLAGGPLASGPLGSVNKMFGRFVSRVAKADPDTIQHPKDLQPLVPGFFDLPLQDLFAPLLNALMGVGGGILGGALGAIADFFSGQWARVEEIHDGQLELNDRTDLLSPLLDYGSAYASTARDISNVGQLWFENQIGPMRNCYIYNGRIILQDKGLWDIRARIYVSWTVSPVGTDVGWEVRVLRPDGTLFSSTEDVFTSGSSQTREINTSVVVPGGTYQVQVYVKTLLAGRWINGGPARSRLTVQHISRSTVNPI